MKIIDRYVAEVGRRLSLVKGRADIEKELRSTLEDMLDDRARKAGRPADEAMEIELLREYGSPGEVAATYNPHPYLIGPRMFPLFLRILKLAAFGIAIGLTVVTIIQIVVQIPMTSTDIVQIVSKGIGRIVSTIVAAFGYVVLTFAVLERILPASEIELDEEKEWDPASLMKEPELDEVKPWEPILAVLFTCIVLSIFNFNSDLIGLYSFDGENWIATPLLTEAFFRRLPWMNAAWIAEIVLNGLLLRAGRWTGGTRIFSIGIRILQVVILALLAAGPSIITITPESLRASGLFNADTAETLGSMAQIAVRIGLGLGIFGTLAEIVKSLHKLMPRKPAVATA